MITQKYAEAIYEFTNFLEQELKGPKSLYFSSFITLLWLIVGGNAEDSSQISNFEKMHQTCKNACFLSGLSFYKDLN